MSQECARGRSLWALGAVLAMVTSMMVWDGGDARAQNQQPTPTPTYDIPTPTPTVSATPTPTPSTTPIITGTPTSSGTPFVDQPLPPPTGRAMAKTTEMVICLGASTGALGPGEPVARKPVGEGTDSRDHGHPRPFPVVGARRPRRSTPQCPAPRPRIRERRDSGVHQGTRRRVESETRGIAVPTARSGGRTDVPRSRSGKALVVG